VKERISVRQRLAERADRITALSISMNVPTTWATGTVQTSESAAANNIARSALCSSQPSPAPGFPAKAYPIDSIADSFPGIIRALFHNVSAFQSVKKVSGLQDFNFSSAGGFAILVLAGRLAPRLKGPQP